MTRFVFEKDPNSVLDYELNWGDWLGTDTIVASTWTPPVDPPNPPTVTASSVDATSKITRVWLSGGELGQDYLFVNHITTTDGRQDDRTVKFQVRDK